VGGTRFSTSMKIAVVDDDPELLRSIEVMLSVAGAKVLGARNGIAGYLMIRRERPDVVLLDIMMPDMDGYEVCRKLKLDPLTKGIPIIFLTAKSGHSHIELGLSLGAQDYITKPFEDGELIGKITKVVKSAKPSTSSPGSKPQD
jgi:two-component system, OmpR family, alkaline phosphatase synthesis response regulator PhoP